MHLAWSVTLSGSTEPIAESSPTVASFPGGPAVVVGDRDDDVYAYDLTSGAAVPTWPVDVGAPVDSTPSFSPATGDVYVGAGNAYEPAAPTGGYRAITPTGHVQWYTKVVDPGSDTRPYYGVEASMSVGTLAGTTSVVAGSLDQEEYALQAANGATLPGWPFFTSDSVFSTAALADLYGTGATEIVEGGDQTGGFALGQHYTTGGHLRILTGRGDLICHFDTQQTVESSPAVGNFLPGGSLGIVVGTGKYFPGAVGTGTVIALDNDCDPQWTTHLAGATTSSPSLAEFTGHLDVVEGTADPTGLTAPAEVYVLDGATGHVLWEAPTVGGVIGSVVTADLTGDGAQDLIAATPNGAEIFAPSLADPASSETPVVVLNGSTNRDGTGAVGFQNSPLVTYDPGSHAVGITLAGYAITPDTTTEPAATQRSDGRIEHFVITLPAGSAATPVGPGSWPQFHHDPELTGYDGTRTDVAPACTVPSSVGDGYDLFGADGAVYSFATASCGSASTVGLHAPIVGAATDPATGGYWMVAADGGVFCFGGAHFYGSMGGRHLNAPIVGMAVTPNGKGYWLVAADGGIFAFGDASFYGSMGGRHLNAPIAGMAATADGLGYRLVAADGGVFTFGPSAQYFGSMGGTHLAKPVVGIADDPATGGYWLVASDGGIFSFGAPFYGSTGDLPLAAPVVGMAATESGAGYRFVAADGGVFSFGAAPFQGSMGGASVSARVVAIAD